MALGRRGNWSPRKEGRRFRLERKGGPFRVRTPTREEGLSRKQSPPLNSGARVNDPVSRSAADLGHGAAALTLARGSLGQPAFLHDGRRRSFWLPPPVTRLRPLSCDVRTPSARSPLHLSGGWTVVPFPPLIVPARTGGKDLHRGNRFLPYRARQ
ncbi:hypothetical protein MRX96_003770 [Rhipicephalus microplus]